MHALSLAHFEITIKILLKSGQKQLNLEIKYTIFVLQYCINNSKKTNFLQNLAIIIIIIENIKSFFLSNFKGQLQKIFL